MTAFLKFIELENFKSYSGKLVIGPFKSFTAIIGPNGCGKSNFMDALSFVMGEKNSSLRVNRLGELVHNSPIGDPIPRRAYVKAVFQLKDGTEKCFTRTIDGSTSEYRINSDVVAASAYTANLQELGINARAKNFLVFQGTIEFVATQSSSDLTSLFENVSGSGALKAEYERLRSEMLQAEEEIQSSYLKKKRMAAEKKEATLEMKEAEKYQQLEEKYAEKLVELQLFRLFHNEKNFKKLDDEWMIYQEEYRKIGLDRDRAKKAFETERRESEQLDRELRKIERDMREVEVLIEEKKPMFIKATERVKHMQKKAESAEKCLNRARIAEQIHQKGIDELQCEFEKIEKMKAAYQATVADDLQNQISNVNLEAEQIREYNRLKEESSKKSAGYIQLLDSANREVKSYHDNLENLMRIKTELENKYKQKGQMRDEIIKRTDKFEEHVIEIQNSLEIQRKLRNELYFDVGTSKEKIEDLQGELENISAQLGDANVDKHELARIRRKSEIVENFKQIFPGVYDRVYNMCEPIHKRYNIAVTKVLSLYMGAIVVDSVKTARQCVQYLKEQYLDAETFLPLDYIQARPIKEHLRTIREPGNVKLLYDVLKFWPKEIDRAILFASRNVLVCETPEDACKVAYEMGKQKRYDCIALDGTCYQKSGIISGGSLDLVKKAKRWDDKLMAQLKSRKEKLSEHLRELLVKSRKKSDLHTIETQIRGLETRLKYNKSDVVENKKEIALLDAELAGLHDELEQLWPSISVIEKTIADRELAIRDLKEQINNIEDEVYRNFCRNIGVGNIRVYEERELQSHQERANKRMEFENQCNRIYNQLEFEKQRDTRSKVLRWERAKLVATEHLESAKQTEIDLQMEIGRDKLRLKQLELQKKEKIEKIQRKEEVVTKWKQEVDCITKQVHNIEKQFDTIETKIDRLLAERHGILMRCKMENITIPISESNLEDVAIESTLSNAGHITSQKRYSCDSNVTINYSQLPDTLQTIEENDYSTIVKNLTKIICDLCATLENTRFPNTKALERFSIAKTKFQSTNKAFEESRKKAKKIQIQFEKVKKERYDKFVPCFEHISKEIDIVYKGLTKNLSAQAFLESNNPEEPYLDGIDYNCVAPGKRFQLISNLSGGEKTVAALALLYAIHSYHPAPFFILDEVDASLDNSNIARVANYIQEQKSSLQTIVISLKEEFYSQADALIGICSEVNDHLRSEVLMIDLTECDE